MNKWRAGDRYKTDDGTVMRIANVMDFGLFCDMDGDTDNSHDFDLNGHSTKRCSSCTHGHLAQRLTGTIQDRGGAA